MQDQETSTPHPKLPPDEDAAPEFRLSSEMRAKVFFAGGVIILAMALVIFVTAIFFPATYKHIKRVVLPRHYQQAFWRTKFADDGKRTMKVVLSRNSNSSCESFFYPFWTFSINKDPERLVENEVFVIGPSSQQARAAKFIESMDDKHVAESGKLSFWRIDTDGTLYGSFTLHLADGGHESGKFEAAPCAADAEPE